MSRYYDGDSKSSSYTGEPLKTTRCPECNQYMQDGWICTGRDPVGWYDQPKFFAKKENVLKTGFKFRWSPAKHCPSCGAVVFKSQGFADARNHPERFTPSHQKRTVIVALLAVFGFSALFIGLIVLLKSRGII